MRSFCTVRALNSFVNYISYFNRSPFLFLHSRRSNIITVTRERWSGKVHVSKKCMQGQLFLLSQISLKNCEKGTELEGEFQRKFEIVAPVSPAFASSQQLTRVCTCISHATRLPYYTQLLPIHPESRPNSIYEITTLG